MKKHSLEKANAALHYTKGTKLEALTQKVSKNSTTKIKGVNIRRIKDKIYYRANIQLAKKRYEKLFIDIKDAISWRKMMEEELFEPLLEGKDKERVIMCM